jgi:ribonucleoside-diphosphate reductase alpha chain
MKPQPMPSVSQQIWEQKYRFAGENGRAERSIEETWSRVAHAVARAEPKPARSQWARRFYQGGFYPGRAPAVT